MTGLCDLFIPLPWLGFWSPWQLPVKITELITGWLPAVCPTAPPSLAKAVRSSAKGAKLAWLPAFQNVIKWKHHGANVPFSCP